jgi:hypothetical protein
MNTFCVLPWIHLATHPDGNVTLCCVSDHTNLMSASKNFKNGIRQFKNLNNNSIEEIVNSDYFRETRLQFLNNEIPEACQRCFEEESNGIKSKRILSHEEFKNFNIDEARNLTSPTGLIKPNLKYVELRLGNKCNHKCRTCNPFSSSIWKDDYKKLSDELEYVTKYNTEDANFDWSVNETFWEDLYSYNEDLEQININGGEPTLIKQHWSYLNKLIEKGKTNIKLLYNINVSYVPDKALEYWRLFDQVNITCSIDDVGVRNSYIRSGSKWSVLNDNLDKLLKEDFNISVCQTLSFMNYYYIDEFAEWLETKKLNYKLHHNIVYDPNFLSPFALPLNVRKIIHKKIEKSKLSKYMIDNLKSKFSEHDNGILFMEAMRYTTYLDCIRDESFIKTFPELHNLLKEHHETY